VTEPILARLVLARDDRHAVLRARSVSRSRKLARRWTCYGSACPTTRDPQRHAGRLGGWAAGRLGSGQASVRDPRPTLALAPPGGLVIGDAARAMAPISGMGINLAI